MYCKGRRGVNNVIKGLNWTVAYLVGRGGIMLANLSGNSPVYLT